VRMALAALRAAQERAWEKVRPVSRPRAPAAMRTTPRERWRAEAGEGVAAAARKAADEGETKADRIRAELAAAQRDHRTLHGNTSRLLRAVARAFGPSWGAAHLVPSDAEAVSAAALPPALPPVESSMRGGALGRRRVRLDASGAVASGFGGDMGDAEGKALLAAVAEHLFRTGRFSLAERIADLAGPSPGLDLLALRAFRHFHAECDDLRRGRVGAALRWVQERLREGEGGGLGAAKWVRVRAEEAAFRLHTLRYLSILTSGAPGARDVAIAYARASFPPFLSTYAAEIRKLVGAVAYVADGPPKQDPIAHHHFPFLFDLQSVADDAVDAYVRLRAEAEGIGPRSSLETVLAAAEVALPLLEAYATRAAPPLSHNRAPSPHGTTTAAAAAADAAAAATAEADGAASAAGDAMAGADGADEAPGRAGGGHARPLSLALDELPVDVELPAELYSRSLFLCPVTRQPMGAATGGGSAGGGAAVLLSCGHAISRDALDGLVAVDRSVLRGATIPCPVCATSVRSSEVLELHLLL
jgi:hypothetical protein